MTKSKKKNVAYEVWMGFIAYDGSVYDGARIATFYYKNRAYLYMDYCNDAADNTTIYWIVEV